MAPRKITKFLGIAPKLSPELLPDAAAQIAVNVKLYSGDLIPYRESESVGSVGRSGELKTIYPLSDPDTGVKSWLSWTTDVDVAVASSSNDDDQRVYYTGDGAPKVTNWRTAISGAGPYPYAAYDLGLPLPTTKPVATPATISAVDIINVSRDSDNIATYETASAHNFQTGDEVSVTGFTHLTLSATGSSSTDDIVVTTSDMTFGVGSNVDWIHKGGNLTSGYFTISEATSSTFTVSLENGVTSGTENIELNMRGFNIKSASIIVIDSTHFTAFSAGPEMTEHSTPADFDTDFGAGIEVELSGKELSRAYIYTWVTPFLEESIPSDPSEDAYVREGQDVTLSSLPTAPPAGDNFIRGIRLYRTVTSASGSTYFLLRTCWFPIQLVSAGRSGTTVTVITTDPHNLDVDDLFKISGTEFGGVADATFDITDGVVLSVVDNYSFTYTKAGSAKAVTACTDGTLYSDVAEYDSGDSTYYEGSTFLDNYDVGGLAVELSSLDADAPDPAMQGLISAHNNMLVGFVGNELCFSEPNKPWSWPIKYRQVFSADIVAIAAIAGAIIVLTDKYPHIVQGSTPANMSQSRADTLAPCIAKRGVVNMGYGVVYPSHGGLAFYSPSSGLEFVTKSIQDWDTWDSVYVPETIAAEFFDGKYFASHSAGAFIFERDDEVGGMHVDIPTKWYAAYYDAAESLFYYTSNTSGQLKVWDAEGGLPLSIEWKSKVFVDPAYTTVGAMRVVADYEEDESTALAVLAYNTATPAYNQAWWDLLDDLGTINAQHDYDDPDTAERIVMYNGLNDSVINGTPLTRNLLSLTGVSAVTVQVWANKTLQHAVTVTSSDIFRLPSAYKSDTFEVSVSGAVRVRAIHMAETPYGLKGI